MDTPLPLQMLPGAIPVTTRSQPVLPLFAAEGLASIGGNLMQVGIFFYTHRRFGWGLKENFTLAAAQGAVYVVMALAAQSLASRFGHRRVLGLTYLVLTAIALGALLTTSPGGLVPAVLAYTALTAVCWPILEGLVSTGVAPNRLARRIATYNVVWAGTAAGTLAVNGAIIDHWPAGVFVLTAFVHLLAAMFLLAGRLAESRAAIRAAVRAAVPSAIRADTRPGGPSGTPRPISCPAAHAEPEPELLPMRTLALWLSRISMPASYALIYALSAILPSLPPLQRLSTTAATLVGSVWLASRLVAFLLLGLHGWWHTRPRALLVAAWVMMAGFAGVALQPSAALGLGALGADLAWLVACQIAIGFAIGLIYSGSLYFGMVLSDGSTEHGGYHEALIGLGSILGPGAGALAQWVRPGQVMLGVGAVGAVLLASTLLAGVASRLAGRDRAARASGGP